MSYIARELSAYLGEPAELYRFVCGIQVWRMTSSAYAITYNMEEYVPVPMERTEIEQTTEANKAELRVTLPRDHELVQLYLSGAPDQPLRLLLYRFHNGDTEFRTFWSGRVVAMGRRSGMAELRLESDFTELQATGIRAQWAPQCRHVLYRSGCNVNDQLFKITGTLIGVNGMIVEAAEFATQPDTYFAGGKVVIDVNGLTYKRMILAHTGVFATLFSPIPGLTGGLPFEAFAGCDHTLAQCHAKFGNAVNFGGIPWKPMKNPFQGDAIM